MTCSQMVGSTSIPLLDPCSFPQHRLSLSLPSCRQGWRVFSKRRSKPQPTRWSRNGARKIAQKSLIFSQIDLSNGKNISI